VSLHHCANCPNRGLDVVDVIASLGANLPACALEQLAGTIDLDRDVYGCADEIQITVVDDSLQGAGTQPVTVASGAEPDAETVVLDEQFPGVFTGTIATTALPAAGGDGLLSLSHADTIVGVYIDADDGAGGVDVPRQDTADCDCAGPGISAVQVGSITPTSAVVSWVTNEPADSLVQYGVGSPGPSTDADSDLVTQHSVALHEVQDCSPHVFQVTSTDALGNAATDDNGGSLYSFLSACKPPVPIPDGSGDTLPILVERLATDGSALLVHWDDQCAPTEAHLFHGALPQVKTYAIAGSLCDLAQPLSWADVPPGSLWFLIAGKNAVGLESSWGHSSFGERKGLSASKQCGTTFKNPQAQCP
jgi:hypothetical protein